VPAHDTETIDFSERSRKRRRSSASLAENLSTSATGSASNNQDRKRARASKDPDSHGARDMRPEHGHQEHQRSRTSTNGSSQNGSSPHLNGSARSNGESNGFHGNGFADTVAANTTPFFGHDREEITRILLQSLSDLGYQGAVEQLSRESGYQLEIPSVAAFRSAVQLGEWEEAETLLFGTDNSEQEGGVSLGNGNAPSGSASSRKDRLSLGSGNGSAQLGLPLSEGADITWLKFLIRQQKYLELLEQKDLGAALGVLRNELTPLKKDVDRLHFLSA
jgi:hypothetical protein